MVRRERERGEGKAIVVGTSLCIYIYCQLRVHTCNQCLISFMLAHKVLWTFLLLQ